MTEYECLKHRVLTAADDGIYEWALDEIDRLRAAVKAFSCDCFEGQCAQWGEDGLRFDCIFRRYRGLVEKD